MTRSPLLAIVASGALVVLFGAIDYLTGHEILFSTFYLIPVALAAWIVGPGFAIAIAFASVGAWVAGDFATGAVYARPFVPYWNAAIVLTFYGVVIVLIGRLRSAQRDLEERVRLRTVALTEEITERERLEREILEVGERERRRIGRDLHDSLGQLLTGTAFSAQVLQERLAQEGREEAGDAQRIVAWVEQGIELTRALSRGLDPVEIESGGLAQGLRELAEKTSTIAKVKCDFNDDDLASVTDSALATHLYRIAQEAVTNALKHGHAKHVAIRLEDDGDLVTLTVRDDGSGLPDTGERGTGMGLRIMAHRALVMHGAFEVRRLEPHGTLVRCEVPNP